MGLLRTGAALFKPKYALIAVAAVAVWEGYLLTQTRPEGPLDMPRQSAGQAACWEAVAKLPELPADGEVAVLRIEGDRDGYLTGKLREVIDRRGLYDQPEPGMIDRAIDELRRRARIPEPQVGRLADALKAGRSMDVPYVLFGSVSEFTSDQQSGHVKLHLTLAEVASGQIVGAPVVADEQPDVTPEPPRWNWRGGLVRVGIWIVVAALLPLLTVPLIRRVLCEESNGATLAALIGYGLVGLSLAFALNGFSADGWVIGLLLLGAFVLALVYDYYVFCWVERRR